MTHLRYTNNIKGILPIFQHYTRVENIIFEKAGTKSVPIAKHVVAYIPVSDCLDSVKVVGRDPVECQSTQIVSYEAPNIKKSFAILQTVENRVVDKRLRYEGRCEPRRSGTRVGSGSPNLVSMFVIVSNCLRDLVEEGTDAALTILWTCRDTSCEGILP